jgi:hypothetical protein
MRADTRNYLLLITKAEFLLLAGRFRQDPLPEGGYFELSGNRD